MTSDTRRRVRPALPIAVVTLALLAPGSARADFFDDARRTFQTDIPHFFQDDVPCAFGGQPTSHTRTSCKSSGGPGKHTSDHPAAPPPKTNPNPPTPPGSGQ